MCGDLTVPSRRARTDQGGARSEEPDAGTIAIAALSHFATEPRTMTRFFALTGLDPRTLRDAAGSPGFIAGVLDFVLADQRVLLAVAAAQETTPEAIVRARASLERPDPAPEEAVPPIADEDWPPRVHDDWA